MMERFIAFDVETPNRENDRISSFGIAVIENGEVIRTVSSLVNPETDFDPFNVWLTGLSEENTKNAPAFPVLWSEIGPILQSGVILAHNAPFDLRVLAKCLRFYRLDCSDYLTYACTVVMGRACCPELQRHSLDVMCGYFSIPLDHHRADSDALACGKLFLEYRRKGFDYRPYLRTYDVKGQKTLPYGRF